MQGKVGAWQGNKEKNMGDLMSNILVKLNLGNWLQIAFL
jgi:hypothetical protein